MHHNHAAAPPFMLCLVEIPIDTRCLHVSLRVPSPIGDIRRIFAIITDRCRLMPTFSLYASRCRTAVDMPFSSPVLLVPRVAEPERVS
eukprot:COSAG01_NODE_2564_length_7448_cov_10.275238_2_plen_88_part_00